MANDFSSEIKDLIRKLYTENESARDLFDILAKRSRDSSATSINRFSQLLDLSRGDAVILAKQLEAARCGEFIVGRRGQPSRFVWHYSVRSLGQAAAGEETELEKVESDNEEIDDEVAESRQIQTQDPVSKITIQQAKELLALSLGVPITCIEIMIKA